LPTAALYWRDNFGIEANRAIAERRELMAKIQYLQGDATSPQAKGNKIVAHICNDLGGWGKGFVLAVSRRWSGPEAAYRAWHRNRAANDFGLGAVQLVQVKPDIWVANMIGQHGMKTGSNGPPIRYEAVDKCLQKLADFASEESASIHMPRIGCGLAGGRWERIEPLIESALSSRGIAYSFTIFHKSGASMRTVQRADVNEEFGP
jgi:O-acetyl-ADP-ribose deacetylase (regulator of RNase III)